MPHHSFPCTVTVTVSCCFFGVRQFVLKLVLRGSQAGVKMFLPLNLASRLG